jgi:hypothetical protein
MRRKHGSAAANAADLPAVAPAHEELDRPKVAFWGPLLQQFPDLNRREVLVVEAFTQFPTATDAELGQKVKLDRTTVNRIRNSDRWGKLLRAFMLHRGDACSGKVLLVLEKWLDYTLAKQARGIQPSADDRPMLEMLAKRGGLLAPEVQINVSGDSVSIVNVVQSAIANMRSVTRPDGDNTAQPFGAQHVKVE